MIFREILKTYFDNLTMCLKINQQKFDINGYYIEQGKAFEETFGKIINISPTCYQDCVDIFSKMADSNGVLSVCRPSSDMLKAYAEYISSPSTYKTWVRSYINGIK